MKIGKKISRRIGNRLEIDWKKIPFKEFHMGMNVELEHGSKLGKKTNVTGNSPIQTGRIALAHLEEDPRYYSKLKKMEKSNKNKLNEENRIRAGKWLQSPFRKEPYKTNKKEIKNTNIDKLLNFLFENEELSSDIPEKEFSLEELSNKESFEEMISYAKKHLGEEIGKGLGRMVFQYPLEPNAVLKIAHSENGIVQNTNEKEIFRSSDAKEYVTEIFDSDADNKWIVSERVIPLGNSLEFENALGVQFNLFSDFLKQYTINNFTIKPVNDLEEFITAYETNSNLKDEFKGQLNNNSFLKFIIELIKDRKIGIGDLIGRESYKHFGKNAEGKFKLYDYGHNIWTSNFPGDIEFRTNLSKKEPQGEKYEIRDVPPSLNKVQIRLGTGLFGRLPR